MNLDWLEQASPIVFEEACAQILRGLGWDARTTPASGDYGADVIAERGDARLVLQCKKHSQSIGMKAVQEIYSAKNYYNAQYAAVVSNSAYTASSKELATKQGVFLLHYTDLVGANEKFPVSGGNLQASPMAGLIRKFCDITRKELIKIFTDFLNWPTKEGIRERLGFLVLDYFGYSVDPDGHEKSALQGIFDQAIDFLEVSTRSSQSLGVLPATGLVDSNLENFNDQAWDLILNNHELALTQIIDGMASVFEETFRSISIRQFVALRKRFENFGGASDILAQNDFFYVDEEIEECAGKSVRIFSQAIILIARYLNNEGWRIQLGALSSDPQCPADILATRGDFGKLIIQWQPNLGGIEADDIFRHILSNADICEIKRLVECKRKYSLSKAIFVSNKPKDFLNYGELHAFCTDHDVAIVDYSEINDRLDGFLPSDVTKMHAYPVDAHTY